MIPEAINDGGRAEAATTWRTGMHRADQLFSVQGRIGRPERQVDCRAQAHVRRGDTTEPAALVRLRRLQAPRRSLQAVCTPVLKAAMPLPPSRCASRYLEWRQPLIERNLVLRNFHETSVKNPPDPRIFNINQKHRGLGFALARII